MALPAGALFGLAGAAWRDGSVTERTLAVAALTGAFAGEALLLANEWSGKAAKAALAAEVLVAMALLLRPAAHAAPPHDALFLLTAIAMAGAEHAVRDGFGWRAGPGPSGPAAA